MEHAFTTDLLSIIKTVRRGICGSILKLDLSMRLFARRNHWYRK